MLSIHYNSCFNHEEIGKHAERLRKIKAFVDLYNWNWINYPSEENGWKKFEKNNLTISLNFMLEKRKHILLIFQNNSVREKQAIILIITKGEGWYYLAVKKAISNINRNNFKT